MSNIEYAEYINLHGDKIAEYVNKCFEESKDYIRKKTIEEIKNFLVTIPIHYEIVYDNNPYDHSGILNENGYISLNQSVQSFLENEYSGNQVATYTSGMGWHYNTYGDELHYNTLEIVMTIMHSAIRRYIENQFNTKLSDDNYQKMQDSCNEFDDIYCKSIASELFSYESVIDFVGIRDVPLKSIINQTILFI